jgi:hypothetical protein
VVSAPTPPGAASGAAPQPAVVADWRLESSLGVQIAVPAHWAINDYGCGMSDKPTVVRGQGVQHLCLTPEKPTKEVAEIGIDSPNAVGAGALVRSP